MVTKKGENLGSKECASAHGATRSHRRILLGRQQKALGREGTLGGHEDNSSHTPRQQKALGIEGTLGGHEDNNSHTPRE